MIYKYVYMKKKKFDAGHPGLLAKRNWIFKGVQIYLTFSLSVKRFYIKIAHINIYIYIWLTDTVMYAVLKCYIALLYMFDGETIIKFRQLNR